MRHISSLGAPPSKAVDNGGDRSCHFLGFAYIRSLVWLPPRVSFCGILVEWQFIIRTRVTPNVTDKTNFFSSRPLFNNGAGTLSVKVRKFLITPHLRPNMWQLSPKMFIFLVDGYFARKYRWRRIRHTRRPFPGIQQIVAVSWIRPYLLRECSILTTKWLYCSQLSEAKTAWKKEWAICLIVRQNESDFISEPLTYPFSMYIDFTSTPSLCEQIFDHSSHTVPFFSLANEQRQYFTSK